MNNEDVTISMDQMVVNLPLKLSLYGDFCRKDTPLIGAFNRNLYPLCA